MIFRKSNVESNDFRKTDKNFSMQEKSCLRDKNTWKIYKRDEKIVYFVPIQKNSWLGDEKWGKCVPGNMIFVHRDNEGW